MKNKVTYKTSKFFDNKVTFGFFTRNGGVSLNPFNTLNCSYIKGEKKENVKKNINLALCALKLNNHKMIISNQIHSNKVKIFKNNSDLDKTYSVDGLITKNKKYALGILTADCAPIFFYDSVSNIIAAAHAGWKGCLTNICFSIVRSMKKLGSKNCNIKAIIGPCINYLNYEVNRDFYLNFIENNNNYKRFFVKNSPNKYIFNLTATLQYQLKNLNIENINIKNEDTYKNKLKYFSHRRTTHQKERQTGRMINIIALLKH